MKIQQLIKKWKLNQAVLARHVGISRPYFANKLAGYKTKTYSAGDFTPEQTAKLKAALKNLAEDIQKVTD